MSINIEVTLTVKTCPCGAIYALPYWIERYRCPMCADQTYRLLQDRFDEIYKNNTRLRRVVIGLRGALKRKKG